MQVEETAVSLCHQSACLHAGSTFQTHPSAHESMKMKRMSQFETQLGLLPAIKDSGKAVMLVFLHFPILKMLQNNDNGHLGTL